MSTQVSWKLRPVAQPGRLAVAVVGLVLLLAACSSQPPAAPAPVAATQMAGSGLGLLDVLDRPAERALHEGMRAYDEGQYSTAETSLREALAAQLRSPRDRAAAHKLLAFVYCTSAREAQCEAAFRAARQADPAFRLNRAEAGHPVWGPVFRRVVGAS
jgi:Tfp pilus assembly protein PilF